MILERYLLSNPDWCLNFREVITSKYFFEAVVGLEQIRRLMAGYRMKGGRIDCAYPVVYVVWRRWLRVVHEDQVPLAGHWHLQLLLTEMKPERLRGKERQGVAATLSTYCISRQK